MGQKFRACVCTSYRADAEPRGPRHAAALAGMNPDHEVVFIDCVPLGVQTQSVNALARHGNIVRWTNYYPLRSSSVLRLLVRRVRQKLARWSFRLTGHVSATALSTNVIGMKRLLLESGAELFVAHNIDTLFPAWQAARALGAKLVFDSMEFHSDMGDSQSPLEQLLIRKIEERCLPDCALVFAASDQIADELVKVYGIARPIALYNTPPLAKSLPESSTSAFQLYWRNSVLGLGQRGLDDALVALGRLPAEITLHLQGRLGHDNGRALKSRIRELGLDQRVVFHPPYSPDDAVKVAAGHTVGLCLERKGVVNHEVTVSNKIFDYHMAGLVTVASDLPGLRAVIEKSGGGLTFQPASVDDLVAKIRRLYDDPALVSQLSTNARAFALAEGNSEAQMEKFRDAIRQIRGNEMS